VISGRSVPSAVAARSECQRPVYAGERALKATLAGVRCMLLAYVGAGQSDLTSQLAAGSGYRVKERWNAVALYRHLRWDFDSGKELDHLEFSGPTLGASDRF